MCDEQRNYRFILEPIISQSLWQFKNVLGKPADTKLIHTTKTEIWHGCSALNSRGPSRGQFWNLMIYQEEMLPVCESKQEPSG